jgi:hypothetical protein
MNKNTSMVLVAAVAGIMVAGALAVTLQTSNAYAQCAVGQPGGHSENGLSGGLSIGGNGGSANGRSSGDANGDDAQNSQGSCSTNN